MLLRLLAAAFLLPLLACTGSRSTLDESVRVYSLGDQTVEVVTSGPGGNALVFFNMHDDENTSVEAAREVLAVRGGRVVELQHTGERLVTFTLDGQTYTFDPNRIFTDIGAERTLARESTYTVAAHAAVRAFADRLLTDHGFDAAPVIVTLHNNTEARYSAASYAAGGDYEIDAEAVHIVEGSDPDDFFFVTDRRLYDALVTRNFNVVLQDNQRATDDGSLSVFAAQRGLPYVNVEAQHGHRDVQVAMIGALVDVLETGGFLPASN